MDRTLKVFAPTGHLFAELTFEYDRYRNAGVKLLQYRRIYSDDEEDESKSVYPGYETELQLPARSFDSIEAIREYDRDLVRRELGCDMTTPGEYGYQYEDTPVLLRYVAESHRGCAGMVDVYFSFINNTKELHFRSAEHPRFDWDGSATSLATNIESILAIPDWRNPEQGLLQGYDLKRIGPWY
ncbi:MAG: hypothetical protein EOO11_19295 [Chitinophagaceae bacterium]|nr:MAG: hypothetical protein EOO11_19295 [Chitinophagaceae bacterium]